MRKIILHLACTLDGFIEGPSGELDWLVRDGSTDFADILRDILADKDALFYGRISYDKWGRFTPDDASPKLSDAYSRLHRLPKYVFSNTTSGDGSGATFLKLDNREQVMAIKQQPGKNIWLYGGTGITTSFLNLGLIDELRLAVHPVLIGKGLPLFKNIADRQQLSLVSANGHSSGVVLLHYRVSQ